MSHAVELAESIQIPCTGQSTPVLIMSHAEIEAFYHAARAEALREAAGVCDSEHGTAGDAGEKIRAMADREGK